MYIVSSAGFERALQRCKACTIGRSRYAAINLADITAAIGREGGFMQFRKVQGRICEFRILAFGKR
jgi:hypothetical protein